MSIQFVLCVFTFSCAIATPIFSGAELAYDRLKSPHRSLENENVVTLVLRDLTVVEPTAVKQFDESGIELENGNFYRWSEVLQISTESPDQSRMMRYVREYGLPEFRFRQRMKLKAWVEAEKAIGGLANPATLPVELQFEVATARFLGRFEQGDRESAAVAFLEANSLASGVAPAAWGQMSDKSWVQLTWPNGVSPALAVQLVPVFFDKRRARQSLQILSKEELLDGQNLQASVYGVSLAIACGELKRADEIWLAIPDNDAARDWKRILNIYLDFARQRSPRIDPIKLAGSLQQPTPAKRGVIFWVDALNRKRENTGSARISPFLKIAALYKDRDTEFASAALFQAFEMLEPESDEARQIKKEILSAFEGTLHCRKLTL